MVQRHARTLSALADRWSAVTAQPIEALNPYEGSPDLNDGVALQLDGVLFMEGEGEPTEVTRIKRDLRTMGDDSIETGSWLAAAMESTWDRRRSPSPTTRSWPTSSATDIGSSPTTGRPRR